MINNILEDYHYLRLPHVPQKRTKFLERTVFSKPVPNSFLIPQVLILKILHKANYLKKKDRPNKNFNRQQQIIVDIHFQQLKAIIKK